MHAGVRRAGASFDRTCYLQSRVPSRNIPNVVVKKMNVGINLRNNRTDTIRATCMSVYMLATDRRGTRRRTQGREMFATALDRVANGSKEGIKIYATPLSV